MIDRGDAASIRKYQRAIVQDEDGSPKLVEDAPIPELLPGTVLVETTAVALNPFDHKMGAASPSPGAVIGNDFAGTVVAFGTSAEAELAVGDLVCGTVHGSNAADRSNGAFALYLRVPSNLVLRVPHNLKAEQAATLGLGLATSGIALWGSILALECSPDNPTTEAFPVLVYGGSTATGTMAIQLLRLSGLAPIATCSPHNFDLVRDIGASAVFDYTEPDVGTRIREYTNGRLQHVLDCITDRESVACCYASIGRTGGRYVSLEFCPVEWRTRRAVKAEFVNVLEIFGKALEMSGVYTRPASTEKNEAAVRWYRMFQRLLDEGKLRTHPTQVLSGGLEGILEGLRLLKVNRISGRKLVALPE